MMERLTLTWTRPDGEEAVAVEFTYETAELASEAVERALWAVNGLREKKEEERR